MSLHPPTMGLMLMLTVTSGCETSPAWVWSHPDRKTVTIDGYDLQVIPVGNRVDVWAGSEWTISDAVAAKNAMLKAAEQVSGCKVADYAWVNEPWYLQAQVNCSSPIVN